MATSNVKRIVNEAIAAYLGANIPGLAGKVSAVQEGPEKITEFPAMAILPAVCTFNPSDPDFVDGDDDTTNPLVVEVGEFEGVTEMQLYAKSKPERELYEQRILDFFLSQEGSPGTLFIELPTLVINGRVTLYSPLIKVRLENAEWNEEFTFEARRYSFMDIEFGFPALTSRDVPSIRELVLALQEDASEEREEVIVDEDGSIS